ncbi:Hypothetical protein R9X50_00714100 [Acrodontium crateriforme]|uniref:Pumilio homology domain family member 3 n=1 Tax=Acrodontium crateriforme TaxID=150365 RepID=A0AAQ3MB06_9PEZI|nr:Hypothetical protein R9X50_00714100 [Acrodontium crateriforme]
MAFSNTQLTGTASSESNNGSASTLNHFGHASNPWGSSKIWSGGNSTLSSGFTSKSTTRDSSRVRDAGLQPSMNRKEEIEGKTGSGSLVDSSVLDEWSIRSTYAAPRGVASTNAASQARYQDSTYSQRRSSSNAGLQALGATNQQQGAYVPRPPKISVKTTTATQQRPTLTSPYASSALQRNSEQASNAYTKLDRQGDQYKKPDSAIGTWADAVSPTDERRVAFPTSHFSQASVPTSRDQSQQPSLRGDERPSFTRPDYSNSSQTMTPLSSRAPSISSQRNGSYNGMVSHTADHLVSQMGQVNLAADHRSSISRKSIGSNSHSSQWSGYNGSRSLSRPSTNGTNGTNGTSGTHVSSEHDSHEGHNNAYPALNDGISPLQNNIPPEYVHSSLGARFLQTPTGFDYRNGQHNNHVNSRGFELPIVPRSTTNWNDYADEEGQNGRSLTIHDPNLYIDPRVHQAIAAQLRNPYANIYDSYAIQNALHQASYLPMMPMPIANIDPAASLRDTASGDGVQSALMYEFRANTKTKKYELKDIYDHIAEFSGDQHGSRFIQTKLESANSDEKERVFREIQPNAIPLMTDVFGNYVVQKFFEHGDQTHKKILANKMRGQVLNLTLQMYGCRVVQKAIDHVLVDQQALLVGELQDHVMKCIKDQNGNHVIQKAIERCPPQSIGFIMDALRGQATHLSIHPYGCRVIQRCLERTDMPVDRAAIMTELIEGGLQAMVADQYGNYVVQHIVSGEDGEGKQRVLQIVAHGLEGYSKHKFASNVVEKCLSSASDEWKREVVCTLANNSHNHRRGGGAEGEGALVGMLKDQFGNYVIQKLLDTLCPEDYVTFVELLQPAVNQAKRTGCGKQILSIEKKMHRFSTYRPNGTSMTTTLNGQSQSQQAQSLSMSSLPFTSQLGQSSLHSLPPRSTAQQHFQSSSTSPSVNSDTVNGATAHSRKNSKQSVEGQSPTSTR